MVNFQKLMTKKLTEFNIGLVKSNEALLTNIKKNLVVAKFGSI